MTETPGEPPTEPRGETPPETHSEPHGAEGTVGPHGVADHGDHGDAVPALGPIDVRMWGAGVLGVGLGLVVAIALLVGSRA